MEKEYSDFSQPGGVDFGVDITIDIIADEVEGKSTADDSIEERHKRYKERIKHFVLMNDPLARVVFDDNPTLEYLLRIIMKRPDLEVIEKTIQADYKNLEGRSVIMDIVAKDSEGIIYNIEIQQKSEGAVPERARYNAGLMDSKELDEGEDFTKLPNSYIIFITDKDETDRILSEETIPVVKDVGVNQTDDDPESPYVHRILRVDERTGRIFKDRQTVIYINSRMPDKTELGRLMHDFHCENPDDMYCEPISSRVRKIKESPKEVESMCYEMDRVYSEGGKYSQVKVALNMITDNLPAEKIAEYSELSIAEVQALIDRKKRKALQPV